jgi:Zn-dependent protease
MGLIQLLLRDPLSFVLLAIPLLYSIIIHELAHGWVAYQMGDPTAKCLGRLSLDPRRHIDPIGMLMLFVFGFGWAKPVPVNFANLRDLRKGLIFVSSAGITANIILAFLSFFILRLVSPLSLESLDIMLFYTGRINIVLALFNLIPIPPLDGSKILMGFATDRFRYELLRLEPYGMFMIMGLFGLFYLRVISLNPLIDFFQAIILGTIKLFLP